MNERLKEQLANARIAWRTVSISSSEQRNRALRSICSGIEAHADQILSANREDLDVARDEGASSAVVDRLRLDESRLWAFLEGVRSVEKLPDPLAGVLDTWCRPSGITIEKVRAPIGVIGMVFEGRPNVTVDSAVLAIKSGNCVVLRGSRSALNTNRAIVSAIRAALVEVDFPLDAVQLFDSTDRSELEGLLDARGAVDLVIPRGGKELIEYVCRTATVPVIETGAGVCHVYIHADADSQRARSIILNAKVQRPSVCNSAETLLVHEAWAARHLKELIGALSDAGVECRGCERTRVLAPCAGVALDADWETEYLDLVLSVRVVPDLDGAIAHIDRFGTRHSEAIVTNDASAAAEFQRRVDAAAVYHNTSTRFTDGFEFGFGAEIGISTQKLHARGPVGLQELTTYKYLISSDGAVRT